MQSNNASKTSSRPVSRGDSTDINLSNTKQFSPAENNIYEIMKRIKNVGQRLEIR